MLSSSFFLFFNLKLCLVRNYCNIFPSFKIFQFEQIRQRKSGVSKNVSLSQVLTQAEKSADFVHNLTSTRKSEVRVFRFQPTPKMSTYLVAMAVQTFSQVNVTNDNGLLIRRVILSQIVFGKRQEIHGGILTMN